MKQAEVIKKIEDFFEQEFGAVIAFRTRPEEAKSIGTDPNICVSFDLEVVTKIEKIRKRQEEKE